MKGRLKYLPSVVLIELDSIKRDLNLDRDSDAFREIVKYTKIGREFEHIGGVLGMRTPKRRKR